MRNLRILLTLLSVAMLLFILSLPGLFTARPVPQTQEVATPTQASEVTVFAMDDPANDDHGPGTYCYPRNQVFSPFAGLFDLRHFEVWYDPDNIYFDLSFVRITNPWDAPEGFFHQLIDIYIDTAPGGMTLPARPGAGVRFAAAYGWEYLVRGMAWGGSRVERATEGTGRGRPRISTWQKGVVAQVLTDNRTIRVVVPRRLLPTPEPDWRYYVLVGAYDGFGPDNYRGVKRKEGEWHFGGGTGSPFDPRVIDLLAPAVGRYTQAKLLAAPAGGRQDYPVLFPVGATLLRRVPPALWWLVVVLLLVATWDLYRFRLRRLPKNNGRE